MENCTALTLLTAAVEGSNRSQVAIRNANETMKLNGWLHEYLDGNLTNVAGSHPFQRKTDAFLRQYFKIVPWSKFVSSLIRGNATLKANVHIRNE